MKSTATATRLMMDDANAPGLLSLPYLGCCRIDDPLYHRTRQLAQSAANPSFFRGTAAEGVGGPHAGLNMIWPMSIIMRALTSTDDAEIRQCLRWLRNTTAGTGFMHESFQKDDPEGIYPGLVRLAQYPLRRADDAVSHRAAARLRRRQRLLEPLAALHFYHLLEFVVGPNLDRNTLFKYTDYAGCAAWASGTAAVG